MTRVRLASITPSAANSVRRRFPLVFAAALVALAITLLGSNAPLFAQEPPPDDYTMDDLFEGGTWGVLSVGESISGNIEEPGDVDFFAVDLAKGNTYRFEMSGSGDTSLSEPRLSGVYLYAVEFECSGAYDDPAVQAYSLIAGESTTYGAGVRADGDGVGGYTLTVTESDETDTGCDTVQPGAEPEQVENTPATGEPTISGAAQVGETLTADVSGIADADGLVNATFSYQWLADDSEVSGAMDSSYALVDADEGKAISVTVTFTDDAGNSETLTSAATEAVAAKPNPTATGAPTISGTAQVGETLTAETSGIADEDGLDNVAFSYQWTAGGAEIAGATDNTYTLASDDEGKAVTVTVTFTDDAGHQETLTSAATAAVAAAQPNTPARGAPAVGGTARVGETLTADTSEIEDADGMDNVAFSYQWEADGAAIPGSRATRATYSLVADDVDKTVTVRVSFTDDAGHAELVTSAPTAAVAAAAEGTDRPHDLTAVASDGAVVLTWKKPVGVGYISDYRILRHRPELGETEPLVYVEWTYTPDTTYTDGDVEPGVLYVYHVKAVVNFLGDLGEASDPVEIRATATASDPEPEPVENSPATGAPAISGTAQVGETLTADTSGIEDEDGLDNATFSYQWLSDDTDISGATNASYTLASDDEGKAVTVTVNFTDDAGNAETLTSAATATIEAKPNAPATGAPTIDGTMRVGETLTANASGIVDEDGLDNAAFSYQWLADGADISGATDNTYTLVADDEGSAISLRVSFADDAGNDETLTSDATAAVAAKPNTPATGAPAISGTAQVGETLTADVSGITDDDGLTNATFSYQWIVNEETGDADSTGASYTVVVADDGSTTWVPADGTADTEIEGATGASYTLTDAEEGRPVRVRVSYTDDAGNEETLISAPTLMASIHDAPSSHDGETDFTFELRFSEELPLSYKTLRDQAFTVTGGTVKKAKRMEQGSNIGWRITVRPDSSGAVTIILPVTEDCDAQGAICTEDGRMLSTRLELTVSGP